MSVEMARTIVQTRKTTTGTSQASLDSMVKARHQSSASFQHPPLTRPLTARQAWKQAQLQPSLAFAKLNSVRASVC